MSSLPHDASAATPRESRFTRYHLFIVLIIGLSIVFDGFDTYTLGLAVPSIARDWGLPPGAFAGITALSTISTVTGSALAGFVSDRIGRKYMLIIATMLYAGGSLISALSWETTLLGFSRVVTGLGLGSAIVTAIVSIAEHVPQRQRSAAITITTLGIPLGHTLAGATASLVLEPLGWRSLFLIGVIIPAIMIAVMALLLPETPAFMRGKPRYHDALERYCRRTGLNPDDFGAARREDKVRSGAPLAALFSRPYRSDTILLWTGMTASVFITHVLAQWLPSLMSEAGASLTVASQSLFYFGMGQIVGAAIATPLIFWFGSRYPMCAGALVILVVAAGLAVEFDTHPAALATFAMFALTACVGSMMVTLHHALGPAIYPEAIRGGGTGLALAIGKSGGILSAFGGAWALPHGGTTFFGLVVLAALTQLVCFGLIRGHAPSGRR